MSKITLYHNTSNANAISISKEGIKGGMRMSAYGKGSEAEGAGVWCSSVRGYGYGGATITFEIDENDENLAKQNDTEYIVYRDIAPDEITDIDLVVSKIVINNLPSTVESTIPLAIKKYGKEKLYTVFEKYAHNFVEPYNMEQFKHLVETGEKYCKGRIELTESDAGRAGRTRKELIEKVHELISVYGRKAALEDLVYEFNDIGFYQEDKRRSKLKYIEDCINNCYRDNEDTEDNRDIERAVNNTENFLEKHKPLKENLDDQEIYLRTFEKQMPEYQGKITDIELGTTKKGEKMLSFKANNRQIRVLEYPRKDKAYYYYVDNKPMGFEGSVAHILEKVVEAKKPYQPKAFVLKGIQDGKSFDIAYDSSRQRLEDFKDELTPGNPNITMWVDENDNVPNASYKLEEASRNELLAKAKAETITRYNKSAGYKGFSLVDIDTTAIKTRDTIIITNRVGNYFDTIELNDILYWVGLEVDEAKDKKMTLEVVRRALLGAMDGMDIKVDCNCGDFVYRFAYMATVLEYKYGKPETRESKITNPDGYGAMCFVKDTKVFTPKGLVPIQDLKIGDEVYTHKGRIRKITNIGSRPVDHTIKMKIGTEFVECTDEHPFLNINNHLKTVEWIPASKLKKSSYVLSPAIQMNSSIKVPDNYAFLLGLFLADGSLGYRADIKDRDVLESNIRIAADDRFKDIYDGMFTKMGLHYSYKVNENSSSGVYSILDCKDLRDFIVEHGGFNYKDKSRKFISSKVFDWCIEDKIDLIRGFFAGDGQYGSNGTTLNMSFLNTNLDLLWKLNLLIRSLGIHARWNVLGRKSRIIEGRQVNNVKDMGYITITGNDIKMIDNDFLHSIKYEKSQSYKASNYKARTVEYEEVKYFLNGIQDMQIVNEPNIVYNITVEDDESYLITREGLAVHNCKHLIALLSNKSWVKQVASTLQQWIVDEIEWVRQFLKVSEEDFKLPDEYARYLGKHGAMKKTWDKIAPEEEEPQKDNEETNEDTPETEETDETTNDTPEEKTTLNNQTNMPKAFRNNNQDDEDLEEK